MASQNLAVQILISAKDAASSVLGSLVGTIGKVGAAVAGIGTAIAAWAGANAFGGAVTSAGDFEAALDKIQSKTGASAEEMERLKAAAIDAGAKTAYTATEAAEALSILGAAGLGATDSIATLPSVLALAKAEGIGLEQAATLITDAVTVMGLSFTDAARATDVMVLAANLSSVSATQMGESLRYAGAGAKAAGLDIEQTAAVLDVMAASGLRGEQAGTSLRNILGQLSDPAGKARTALAELGITSGDLSTVLDGLAAAGPAGEEAIRAFGIEAGPGVRALLAGGSAAIADYTAKLRESAGAAEEAAKTMSDNLWGSLDGLSSAWDTLRMKLVEPLLEPLKREADALAATLSTWTESAQLEKIRLALGAAFEAGIAQVKAFASTLANSVDWNKFADAAVGWAERVKTTMDGWAKNTKAAIDAAKVGVSAIGVAWDLAAGLIHTAAATIAHALAIPMAGYAKIAEVAAWMGVISEETAAKFRNAAESMESSAKTNLGQAGQHFREAGETIGLIEPAAEGAATATKTLATEVGDLPKGFANAAQSLLGLTDAQQQAVKATEDQKASLVALKDDLVAAREEYDRLISEGDAQGAAEKLREIEALKKEIAALGSEAKVSSEAVEAAFKTLGVTSSAALAETAANAKTAFDTIRASGTATPADIQQAFIAYATAAIAANNGVASAALAAQANQMGLQVQSGETGDTIVKKNAEVVESQIQVSDGAVAVADAFEAVGTQVDETGASLDGFGKSAESSGGAALAMDKILRGVVAQLGEVSAEASAAVESIIYSLGSWRDKISEIRSLSANDFIDTDGIGTLRAELSELEASAEAAETAARGLDSAWQGAFNYFSEFYTGLGAIKELEADMARAEAAAKRTEIAIAEMGDELDDLTTSYDAGELGLTDYIAKLKQLQTEYATLSDDELEDLTDALKDAEEAQQDLTDTARDGLTSWREKLAGIYDQEVQIQQLNYQQDRLETELALAEAKRNNNAEEIAALTEQLNLIDEYYALQIASAAADEAQAKIDAANDAADEAARRASLTEEERAYEDLIDSLKDQLAAAIVANDAALQESLLAQIEAEKRRHETVIANLDAETKARQTTTDSRTDTPTTGTTTASRQTTTTTTTAASGSSAASTRTVRLVIDSAELFGDEKNVNAFIAALERAGLTALDA